MKPENLSLLALALLTTLVMGACGRDRDTDSDRDAASAAMQAETAAMAEPVLAATPESESVRTPAPVATDTGMSFTDMDKNMDSGVTRDELTQTEMLHQHFNEADTNGDGNLSVAEVERHRIDMVGWPQPAMTDGRSFAQMDKNGDDGISHDELWDNEMLYRHFDEADADADGKLSSAEVEVHRRAMAVGE